MTVSSYLGQSEGLVEFPERQKHGVGRDLGAMELQFQSTVEIKPQSFGFTFTQPVSRPNPSNPTTTHWFFC
jgi:hypothetical protein